MAVPFSVMITLWQAVGPDATSLTLMQSRGEMRCGSQRLGPPAFPAANTVPSVNSLTTYNIHINILELLPIGCLVIMR